MEIKIISVGKLGAEYSQMADHYRKMIKFNLQEHEIVNKKKLTGASAMSFEEKAIDGKLSPRANIIALDEQGKHYNSIEFANMIENYFAQNIPINFIIGGAFGLPVKYKNKGNLLSLSKMTLPHKMAKLVLLEQIYRAQTIIDRHPYHKE